MVVAKFLPPSLSFAHNVNYYEDAQLDADTMLALQQLKREQAYKDRATQNALSQEIQAEAAATAAAEAEALNAADARHCKQQMVERRAEAKRRQKLLKALSVTEPWEPTSALGFGTSIKLERPPLPAHWYSTEDANSSHRRACGSVPPPPLMLLPRMPSDGKTPERVRIDLELAHKRGKDKAKRARQRISKAELGSEQSLEGRMQLPVDFRASMTSRMEDRLQDRFYTTMPKLATPSVVFTTLQRPSSAAHLQPAWLRPPSSASRRDKPDGTLDLNMRRSSSSSTTTTTSYRNSHPQSSWHNSKSSNATPPLSPSFTAPRLNLYTPESSAPPPWSPWGADDGESLSSPSICGSAKGPSSPPLRPRGGEEKRFQRMLQQSTSVAVGPFGAEFARLDGSSVSCSPPK